MSSTSPDTETAERHSQHQLLVCADWFDPGIRAGGPIRSCVNLAMLLGPHKNISIITSDRDLGATAPYPDVVSDQWASWRNLAQVLYCSSGLRRMSVLAEKLRQQRSATLYLNSMFSVAGTLWPLLWTRFVRRQTRVILAPRGMLKPSALNHKRWKKQPVISLIRLLGLTRHVIFHATSEDEIQEIKDAFGNASIRLISNVPTMPADSLPPRAHTQGTANLCFVGRVHPIKNLLWLLQVMQKLTVSCRLTVVGPIEDQTYYEQCQSVIAAFPENVSVELVGSQPEPEVRKLLIKADAMIMPTHGENFGHAIFESFAVGTPVIISDRTIWRNLEAQQAGWDLNLDDPDSFKEAITVVAEMSDSEHDSLRTGALQLATRFVSENQFESEYQEMFWG